MMRQDVNRRLVAVIHKAAHLFINLHGGAFAKVAMLRDLAAQEYLLFLFAVSNRAESGHAELANHLARQLGRLLDIVAGTGGHGVEEQFLGDATELARKMV